MAKVALVTAGARRLGRAIALALGRAGWDVAVHHRSRAEEAEATVRELEAMGARAAAFAADFGAAAASTGLVSRAVERFDRLDLLVHAASPFVERDVSEVSEREWDAAFDAVAKAGFFLAQAAAPALRAARGSVVYLSDVAARKAWPRHVPHAAAKAALDALVRNLAVALAPEVRVNAVAPGIVIPPPGLDEDAVARLVAATPLKRRVAVEDVCDAVLFLAENPSITGHVLDVDAGRMLR